MQTSAGSPSGRLRGGLVKYERHPGAASSAAAKPDVPAAARRIDGIYRRIAESRGLTHRKPENIMNE